MGVRYRKSINLGLGFKVNISKSGIGYSWGFPGYRKSISSLGRKRTTISIPGTGLSYSYSESKKASNNVSQNKTKINQSSYSQFGSELTSFTEIRSANIENFQTGEFQEFTKALSKAIFLNKISNVLIILSVLLIFFFSLIAVFLLFVFILIKIYIISKCKNCITYEMDDYAIEQYSKQMQSIMALNNCNKLWQILNFKKVSNQKYSAGAERTISRSVVKLTSKTPFYLRSNLQFPNLKLKNERIFFLPDKILLVRKNKVGAIDYKDTKISVTPIIFIEDGVVPKDTEIVGTTWRYVNKNGTPDKRFSNNRQLPKCKYGKITITSASGLNVELQASNYNIVSAVRI